jgi:hypothetical protein
MKTSSVLSALIVALMAVALTSDAALAAITVNGTKSNTFKAINASDPAAVAACTKGGGTVGKDPDGKDACITPKKK